MRIDFSQIADELDGPFAQVATYSNLPRCAVSKAVDLYLNGSGRFWRVRCTANHGGSAFGIYGVDFWLSSNAASAPQRVRFKYMYPGGSEGSNYYNLRLEPDGHKMRGLMYCDGGWGAGQTFEATLTRLHAFGTRRVPIEGVRACGFVDGWLCLSLRIHVCMHIRLSVCLSD